MTWLSKGFRGSKRIRWIGTKNMKRVVNGKQDETTKIPISFCNGFATCKITSSIAIYKIGLEKSFDYNIVKRGIIMSIEIRWVGEG